jgi:predicted O-linked N-acetylglucosamine transferase (SPINDLY family)
MQTIPSALALALQHHQAGRMPQAEALYRQVLQADPRNADAWHLLGVAAYHAGRHDEAIAHIRHAIVIDPGQAIFHNNLGLAYQAQRRLAEALAAYDDALRIDAAYAGAHNNRGTLLQNQGRLAEAEVCYRGALRARPDWAEAHCNLGVVLAAQGRPDEAIACYREAARLSPDGADAYLHLGRALHQQGHRSEALACYRQRVRLKPRDADAHNILGTMLQDEGDLGAAIACYREAVRLRPDYAEAHNNLGGALRRQGRLVEAAACCREALRLRPDYAGAHNSLGAVYHDQGDRGAAIACYREAIRLRPDFAQAHFNLGIASQQQGDTPGALARYREAVRLRPTYAEAHTHLGSVLQDRGDLAEAIACYDRALALAPSAALRVKSALALPVILESTEEMHRQRRRVEDAVAHLLGEELTLADPATQVGRPVFELAYHGRNDRDLQAAIARLYARATPSLNEVAPHCMAATPPQHRPLRVGFLSAFFHNHTISKYYGGLIRHLSRKDFRVTLCRIPGPDDDVARQLQEGADAVVTLMPGHALDVLRRQIAAQQLDLLCYTDIGMDARTYFLAFARLAPVQCVLPGHPVTTGIPTLDYFLSHDDMEPPDAGGHYTEQLVRLRNIPSFFVRPEPSGPPRCRGDYGLAEEAHLYLCAQALFKIHPDFDALAAAILRADPRGRLVLFEGNQDRWTELLAARLRRNLGDEMARVQLLPRLSEEDYLHVLSLADVLLDTPHFSGGTTSLQALGVGTPIVTLPGRFMRGRQTYGFYRQMGMLDCVAADAADYVRQAVRLGTDPAWREQVCARIRAARGVLFENRAAVRELEQVFRELVAARGRGR